MRAMRTRSLLFTCCLALGCSSNPATSGSDGSGGGAPDLALGSMDTELTMTTFTVPAGGEVFKCQNFANPFGGDAEIREWESHMTTGSHHLLVFYQPNATDGAIEDCSGLEFHSGPFGAQTPDATISYPDGIAALLPAGTGLRFASHYLNATQQPITATVKLIMRRAAQGTVHDHAGIFFFNNVQLFIPATGMPYTVTKTCTAPTDMNLLYSTGHMHRHATNLTAMLNGQPLYTTDKWDGSPFQQYLPPTMVKKGDQITFTCTYVNDTGAPLIFGESAQTNEMCIFDGQFYPSTGQDIVCQ